VKILLDENFPRPFLEAIRAEGHPAARILTLCIDGLTDGQVRERLDRDRVLFLTDDTEFLTAGTPAVATVLVLNLSPSRPLAERIALWLAGIRRLLETDPPPCVFELTDAGEIVPGPSTPAAFPSYSA
jgi:hypothetical protein